MVSSGSNFNSSSPSSDKSSLSKARLELNFEVCLEYLLFSSNLPNVCHIELYIY